MYAAWLAAIRWLGDLLQGHLITVSTRTYSYGHMRIAAFPSPPPAARPYVHRSVPNLMAPEWHMHRTGTDLQRESVQLAIAVRLPYNP